CEAGRASIQATEGGQGQMAPSGAAGGGRSVRRRATGSGAARGDHLVAVLEGLAQLHRPAGERLLLGDELGGQPPGLAPGEVRLLEPGDGEAAVDDHDLALALRDGGEGSTRSQASARASSTSAVVTVTTNTSLCPPGLASAL